MKKDYTSFTVSDFLTDDTFVNHQMKPTPQSDKFWIEWCSMHNTYEYDEAVDILRSVRLGLKSYEETKLSAEAKSFIFSRIQETNQKIIPLRRYTAKSTWMAAASIIVLLVLGYYFFPKPSSYKRNLSILESSQTEEKKALTKPLLIHLPDGSAVKLAPRSKISYPVQFEKEKRVVILSGEATFDIAKDPSRPFLVIANEVTTKVLGTRFRVKAYENRKEIEVSVEEGKVSVYKNAKTDDTELKGVILLPNQQAIFDRETDQYDKKLIQTPSIISSEENLTFDFEETPLKEVIRRLEVAYGIEIVFDETLLKDCQVTGRFENESLFQKLDIITKIVGGSYEVLEGKIVINSRGCH